MRKYSSVRRRLFFLRHTLFHPQWFAFRQEIKNLRRLGKMVEGIVLDIGCSDQRVRQFLDERCHYMALDYYQTATQWYKSRPQIYGDAQILPFCNESIDSILLLDVLEHLPRPENCISEIKRVLKPGGKFILQVPFIYPIHDAPLDFQRWTIHGLRELASKFGFEIKETVTFGGPLETAALLTNIASSKTLLECIKQRNPVAILVIFLPFSTFIINVLAWFFTMISPNDYIMPRGYQLVCVKNK